MRPVISASHNMQIWHAHKAQSAKKRGWEFGVRTFEMFMCVPIPPSQISHLPCEFFHCLPKFDTVLIKGEHESHEYLQNQNITGNSTEQ